jgi:DUF1680 family protein
MITIKEVVTKPVNIYLRIPGWCKRYTLKINNVFSKANKMQNGYVIAEQQWKAGDKIELLLDMPATLLESNPLVEENKNQVAVKRGPIVYCLESPDLPHQNVFDVMIPASIKLKPAPMKIDMGNVMALTGEARLLQKSNWTGTLYKEVNTSSTPIKIKLIPYYAWSNRGQSDMTVWMPLMRTR